MYVLLRASRCIPRLRRTNATRFIARLLPLTVAAPLALAACERLPPTGTAPMPVSISLDTPDARFRLNAAERANIDEIYDADALERLLSLVQPDKRVEILAHFQMRPADGRHRGLPRRDPGPQAPAPSRCRVGAAVAQRDGRGDRSQHLRSAPGVRRQGSRGARMMVRSAIGRKAERVFRAHASPTTIKAFTTRPQRIIVRHVVTAYSRVYPLFTTSGRPMASPVRAPPARWNSLSRV